MLFDRYFMPDLYLPDIYGITPVMLRKIGIRALIMDIDNTMVTYDDPEPTPKLDAWIAKMLANGIRIALVSNNESEERVRRFNQKLGFYATAKSKKPLRAPMKKALAFMDVQIGETAVVGDQIFTDVFAGKRMGMYSILVKPIRDKTSLFFRFKRKLEAPILRRYEKKNGQRQHVS